MNSNRFSKWIPTCAPRRQGSQASAWNRCQHLRSAGLSRRQEANGIFAFTPVLRTHVKNMGQEPGILRDVGRFSPRRAQLPGVSGSVNEGPLWNPRNIRNVRGSERSLCGMDLPKGQLPTSTEAPRLRVNRNGGFISEVNIVT